VNNRDFLAPWKPDASCGRPQRCDRRVANRCTTTIHWCAAATAPDHIADLLPSAGARVLITSRFLDWSELADEVPLDVLLLVEAVTFLQSRT
jgi:hypothetical protein